jgi:hypothetical protein
MNDDLPTLQIQAYRVDGLTKTFFLNDPELVHRALMDLNASLLFSRDAVRIADGDSEITLPASHLTRIDLISDWLSVWDFPFVLGALMEVTEMEFLDAVGDSVRAESDRPNDIPVFLDLTMAQNQRWFFWMKVVGGLPAVRLSRIQSMLNGKSLVFGLQTNGIGILNLANLTHFSIHPEPLETIGLTAADHELHGYKLRAARFEVGPRRLQNGEPNFIRLADNRHAA